MTRSLVVALLASTLAAPASGQTYVGVGGGTSLPKDTVVRLNKSTLIAHTDDGWNASAVAGVRVKRFRFELEARRSQMAVPTIEQSPYKQYHVSHNSYARQETSLFFNATYAQPLNRSHTVSLFGGGGVGLTRMQMRAATDDECHEGRAIRISHTLETERTGPDGATCRDQGRSGDTVFAWQALAGLDLRPSTDSRWSLSPTVRYTRNENVETTAKTLKPREVKFRTHQDYSSVQVAVMLRREF